MKTRNALKYLSASIAIIALTATLILAYSPTQAQSSQDSKNLATFVALMQHIRSTPTPADVDPNKVSELAVFDSWFSDIYITGFITPFTDETPEQVKARLQSVREEYRFIAVMVESYRLSSNPLLLDIMHSLLAQYYVSNFITTTDLSGAREYLKRPEMTTLAAAFDGSDYKIPNPSVTGTTLPPSTRGSSNVDSANLATFVALMERIRSTPTPSDVDPNKVSELAVFDSWFSDIYITGFITPFTDETPEQVKARLQSVREEYRFIAVMVESYRLSSNPLLLDIMHSLLAQYYVSNFITTTDLSGAREYLKRSEITTLAGAFDPADYAIPRPSTTEPSDIGSPATDRAALIALYNATDGPNWSWNENWLTDEPLSEWFGVTTDANGRVTRLNLWNKNLSGPIPSELGDLTKLTQLNLGSNQLSGGIPLQLGNLTNLQLLYLYSNQLSGPIPPELGSLSNLESLSLWGNRLSGSIPPELGNLSNLESLFLHENQLSGSIPSLLSNLSNLELLNLRNNQLSGSIPSELGSLSKLESLWLRNNRLTGCIPNTLGDTLRNDFSELNLSFCSTPVSNPADKAILEAFYNATGGANWSTSTNWLTNQPISLWYGVATDSDGRVTSLFLWNNDLSGSIPTNLDSLSGLEYLDLRANELSGSIPSNLGNLTNLKQMYLFSNQLTGNIPASLGNLTNLTSLYLNRNRLTGEIPPELGNLTNLQYLDISENQLRGALPQALTKLTELRNFYFFENPQLCAPLDVEAFQTWLDGIDDWYGNSCVALADRAVLETLYHATDGPNWATNDNWLSDQPLWDWHGVGINQEGRVIGLWLDNNQLSGSIPSELGKLTKLEWLYLWGNQLSGNIPSELGNLTNLKTLSLDSNQLSGSIPPELGNLTKLESLSLWGNELSGNIPSELGNLTNLTWLSLSHNQLSGSIPQTFTSITGLETFWFGDNDGLCAPTDTAFVTWLRDIDSRGGPSCGDPADKAVLVALYNATDGPNWSTSTDWLTDKPLEDWYNVGTDETGRVDSLVLYNNGLSGSIPTQLGNLAKLKTLELGRNQLSGAIPSELGNLTNLEKLSFSGNQLTGSIPSDLGKLSKLEDLYLRENDLIGNIPKELGNLSNLEVLALEDNKLTGATPPELGNLTNLEYLRLNDNQLSGGILSQLGNLSNLESLNLGSNQLSGSIPSQLGNLSNLESLNLSHNQLSGAIPTQLGNLTKLEYLRLNDNQLSGAIPTQLGNLTNLKWLFLHNNQLSGAIPTQLGSLTKLEYLYLYNNQLSGAIPTQLGNLTNLQRLYLHDNQLSGAIPPELGNLSNLQRLYLHRNQLNGDIPSELGNLTNMERLYLSGNDDLTGCVPAALSDISENDFAALGLPFCDS